MCLVSILMLLVLVPIRKTGAGTCLGEWRFISCAALVIDAVGISS